jgi:hypothetical protein
MPLPSPCFVSCLLLSAFAGPTFAGGECGTGCSTTAQGACVRDGWQQGLPVRNKCPATTRPTPRCGRYHHWSRLRMACVEN